MKKLILLVLIVACSHSPTKKEEAPVEDTMVTGEDLVSVIAALNHAQMSYLKGCTDAFREMKQPPAFDKCKTKAILHRKEIEYVLTQKVQLYPIPGTELKKAP